MNTRLPLFSLLLAVTGALACSSTLDVGAPVGQAEAAERWDEPNNPMRLGETFTTNMGSLPVTGAAASTPIPAHYWPTAQDSINDRWDGEDSLSPAEKYEKAFGQAGLAQRVSQELGIRSQTRRAACDEEEDCAELDDDSVCAIPRGEKPAGWTKKGRCIPMWWGICHGWAPYAFSELPAKEPVTMNGVTFYASDLEALMSTLYSKNLQTKFLSSRCNRSGGEAAPGRGATTDATGRVVEGECRDMNPGSFHVLATNKLGLRKESFVYDRTWDAEVWNQPVRDYAITNAVDGKVPEISGSEAMNLLGLGFEFKEILPKTRFDSNQTEFIYKATSAGVLVFRTAGSGEVDLVVSKGDASVDGNTCSSSEVGASEECKLTVAIGDEVRYRITSFDVSEVSVSVGAPSAGRVVYSMNPTAERFFHVKMDFRYISEPRPSRTPASFDKYTRTDRLEYIVETNRAGEIQGGEWVGESRRSHPDFAWYPAEKLTSAHSVAGIRYDNVKQLNDRSAGVSN